MNVLAAIVAWAYAGHIQSGHAGWDGWTQLRFAAQTGLPLAILALCLELAGRRRSWLGGWRLTVIGLIPAAFIILAGTNESHQLFIRRPPAAASGSLLSFSGEAGPVLWLFLIRDVLAGGRVIPAEIAHGMAERAYQSDLSPRESDVIGLVVEGLSNKAIAARLGLTEATVKTHVTHIFEKLGVEDRTQAALAAVKRGIVRSN